MKKENTPFFTIGNKDAIKAFWMFLFATVVSIIGDALIQAFSTGTYSFADVHWKEIGAAILVAVLTYLKKQLLTNSKGEVLKNEEEIKYKG